MRKTVVICGLLGLIVLTLLSLRYSIDKLDRRVRQLESRFSNAARGDPLPFPLLYSNKDSIVLEETGSGDPRPDPNIWINSGGLFYLGNGLGRTVAGELPKYSRWRILYALSNPRDTDNGYHPQNIFRLIVTKGIKDTESEVHFRITKNNNSDSPYRNASNGTFLLHHYEDSDNLYYFGLRVDGAAVVKKKRHGVYETLAYKPLFEGTYDRIRNPNLLPQGAWLGIKAETRTLPDTTVLLRLFASTEGNDAWRLIFTIRDTGKGRPALTEASWSGLRSDFMDIEIKDFKVAAL